MSDKSCKKCAWWEPPQFELFSGYCHHGNIDGLKGVEQSCSNWTSGPKKWKSEHIQKSYKLSVHDEIARLRAANAILVEALQSINELVRIEDAWMCISRALKRIERE